MPITTPPPPPRPSRAPLSASLPSALPSSAAPPSSPGPASPGRRGFLLAGGAVGAVALLGGCSDGSTAKPDAAGRGPGEQRLLARGARDSAELLARYDATADAHPGLADRLRPLREETARHLEAFRAPDRDASSGGSSASAPSASASSGKPPAPKVPGDEKEALAALARAERRTADTRTAALRDAPPELARLLASVAACGAAHAYLLTAHGS
ncbi:lipoprotein [Streptomyces cuspidosporus]|uniref:Lipoprotein n=1 Tax=Streptomyces cuspidosporus TaxID=66882 RepID=A0ABN3HFK7_9ACTN